MADYQVMKPSSSQKNDRHPFVGVGLLKSGNFGYAEQTRHSKELKYIWLFTRFFVPLHPQHIEFVYGSSC